MEAMNCQGTVNPGTTAPAEERRYSWLKPWLFLISALVIKTAFLTIFLVVLLHGSDGQYKTLLQNSTVWHCVPNISADKMAPFSRSNDQPTALQEKFTAWECNSAVSQGKGWTCCPKGWKTFQKSCYFLSHDKMSWVESVKNCTEMGSHLAVINSREEQVFLSDQIRQASRGGDYYIGLRAQSVDQWQWVDKTPYNVTAMFWREGEPSDHSDENCVAIHRDSELPNNWNNVVCEMHHRTCEAAAVTVEIS